MTSVDFLKSELQIIADKFPNVHIKYGYNNIIETHVIELLPLIEYTNNVELDRTWVPLSLQFMEIFNEDVTFISSDSSLSIRNVIFEFNASCTDEKIFTEIYAALTNEPICYTFPVSMQGGYLIQNSNIDYLNMPVQNLGDEVDYGTSYLAAAA